MRAIRPALLPACVLPWALAFPLPCATAQDAKIHPYTAQLTAEWRSRLDAAEAASRPGGDPEKALPVLEGLEGWFQEKQQTLERHPDYKTDLKRQLLLRIKLARITAVKGLALAEAALKQQKGVLLTGKGGAYEQLEKADRLVQSLAAVLGDQPAVKDTQAYVEQVRGKVKEKASQVKGGGGDLATAAGPGVKLHPYTQQTFETWAANLAQDAAILAGTKPTEEKIKELEGGRRWFESSHAELKKHPNFEAGLAKMTTLMVGLAELKGRRAVEFAEKGLKDMNPNMFSESSGTYQQIKEGEKLLAEFGGGADAASAKASLEAAKAQVARLSDQYSAKAAAAFRLPPEAYGGADKAHLKGLVLAKWKEHYPADQVLGVRFLKGDWERRKESNWNNGSWYHYDNSVLLVYVVVRKSAELATVYPAYINKNNQTGAIAIGAQTKGNSYSHQDMLMKNVAF